MKHRGAGRLRAAAWASVAVALACGCKEQRSPKESAPVPSASAGPPADTPRDAALDPSSRAPEAGAPRSESPSLEDVRKAGLEALNPILAAGAALPCDRLREAEAAVEAAGLKAKEEHRAALGALAECAFEGQRMQLLLHLAALLDAAGDDDAATLARGRALSGLGAHEDALRTLGPIAKGAGRDPDAVLAMGAAGYGLGDLDGAIRRADQTLALLGKKEGGATARRAHELKAQALLRRGKLDDAAREADAAAKLGGAVGPAVQAAVTAARERRLLAEVETPSAVYLGLYAQYGRLPLGPLAAFRFYNVANRTVSLQAEAALPGITQTASKVVKVVASLETARLTPPLSPLFDGAALREPEGRAIVVKAADTKAEGAVYADESREVRVYPASYVPLAVPARGGVRVAHELLATRVPGPSAALTPLLEAVRAQEGGRAEETVPRAKALWQELAPFTFTRASSPTPDDAAPVRVRDAAELLSQRGGSSYEGATLVAGALAALGLDALLVVVPGHAFPGWLATKADRQAGLPGKLAVATPLGDAYFLEVTSAGQRPFETALLRGNAEYVDHAGDGAFAQYRGSLLRLRSLARSGSR